MSEERRRLRAARRGLEMLLGFGHASGVPSPTVAVTRAAPVGAAPSGETDARGVALRSPAARTAASTAAPAAGDGADDADVESGVDTSAPFGGPPAPEGLQSGAARPARGASEVVLPPLAADAELKYRVAAVFAVARRPLRARVVLNALTAHGFGPNASPENGERSVRRAMREASDLEFRNGPDGWTLVTPVRLAPGDVPEFALPVPVDDSPVGAGGAAVHRSAPVV